MEQIHNNINNLNSIQSDVLELKNIASDMNTILSQQGEQLTNIENKVEQSHDKTCEAISEIKKAMSYKNNTLLGTAAGLMLATPVGLLIGTKGVIIMSASMLLGRTFKII